jgi:hypothetical protein
MIPELSAVYSLSPEEVWEMSRSQYGQYLEHHAELVRRMKDGR